MTGYQSKKAAASAKTIDEVNWADHEPDGRRAAAQDKLDSMEREALKLALEALENPWKAGPDGVADAITAIKETLAQPEQRPLVGLTDEEAQWLYDNCRTPSNLIDMVEAALKEKNT